MSGPVINFPTPEENQAVLLEFLQRQNAIQTERRQAAIAGIAALDHLISELKANHSTGQPYKVRALLYSLWNGKPVELTEVLCLDWDLRKDICAVILGFGFESPDTKFFYQAVQDRLTAAYLFEWFLQEADNGKGEK